MSGAGPRANNFNLIRLLLATSVLVSHAFEMVDGDRRREPMTMLFGTLSLGELAVDGFFIVSGFLIVQSWRRDPRLAAFAIKRVMRIYPGFVVASLVCAGLVGPLAARPEMYWPAFDLAKFVAGMSLLAVPFVPPVFAGLHYPSVNASMWTISYEFRCYVLTALLGLANASRLLRAGVIAGVVAAFALLWPVRARFGPGRLSAGRCAPSLWHRGVFLGGATFHAVRHRLQYSVARVAVSAGLLAAAMSWGVLPHVAVAILGGYLLFGFAFAPLPALLSFRRAPDISYGIYLYGWPVQALILWQLRSISPLWLLTVSIAVAVVCAWISWHLVERPSLELGRRLVDRRTRA